METLKTKKSKLLVMLIVFMLLFSNFGYTIASIATSEEFEVISKGFFKKDEIKFNSYFVDENGKQTNEITENVNKKVKLVVEILPQIEGYLKDATLKAVSSNEDNINFKITSVTENLLKESQSNLNSAIVEDSNKTKNEEIENNELVDALVPSEEGLQQVEETNEDTNTGVETQDELLNSLVKEETTNPLLDALSDSEISNKMGIDTSAPNKDEGTESEEDTLVDEDAIIEENTEESRIEEIRNAILDIKVVSENEISLSNIIEDTKFEIELEYNQAEKFNVSDLYKNIKLQLSGTYINRDLEEIQIGKENNITIGWEYTKDISLESEYTKFSPFELEDIKGTIVENKITVTRDIQDEKYLPIKSTRLEIVAPKVNGKNPIDADVIANKLLATKGEDYGHVVFEEKNWRYEPVNGTINIFVENDNNIYSAGADEYVIIYRYEDYIDGENSNLSNNIKATITEYSGKENNTIIKEIKDSQDIKVDVDELVTYNIGANGGKVNKSKIYANYNSEAPLYETTFTNQVNVNILTSDVLEQLKLDCSKDVYKDVNGVEVEAKGIEYKQIKFNYPEVSSILSEGGEIVITNLINEPLYVLNKESITKEEDCIIDLNGIDGIYIYANNVSKNGTINFELTKAIKKCNYDKSIFKNFTEIESRISADVKYTNIEERIPLQTISAVKYFEESQTIATLSIDRDSLSTLRQNDNVELKIQLNNDKETSDLYINPSFEIVFPKYVTSVGIESINLLNDCGLRVSDFETYTENDIVKIRIELAGIQTMFSENTITNGTNIIVNANIKVDEYAPAKQDQIKLYYCNEGVATYQTQTKWTIKKKTPTGILKNTNGFDVETIKYQAPVGLIAINGIVNYDGNLGEVRTVKQGAVSEKIAMNAPSRVATMELLALNNTDNKCKDVVLMGRIPFKGNTDIISNETLGTTIDAKMVDSIKEDVKNINTTKIYYSSNPTATRDLEDTNNGWSLDVQDISSIKSYMIVVEGELEAGSVLRYTYDFEIPENLPYESKIAGSFAAFYNNIKEEAVVYESSSADEVALETETGPKIEAILSVDAGNNVEVGECRYLTYTLRVKNTGSIDTTGVKVNFPRPDNVVLCEYNSSFGFGNNNWVVNNELESLSWDIDTFTAGEEKEYTIVLKTNRLYDKTDITVKAKANVTAENLGITIESNEISNKLVKSNFDFEINTITAGDINMGTQNEYRVNAVNISEKDLENVRISFKVPEQMTYRETKIIIGDDCDYDQETLNYNSETHMLNLTVNKIPKYSFIYLRVGISVTRASEEQAKTYMSFYTDDGKEERTSNCNLNVFGPRLEVKQVTNTNEVLEREKIEFAIEIQNVGNGIAEGLHIKDEISEYLQDVTARYTGSANSYIDLKDGNIDNDISEIPPEGKIVLTISGTAKDLEEGKKENRILNQAVITGPYVDTITTDIAEIIVKENPNKVEEKPEEDKPINNVTNGDDNNNDDNNNSSDDNNNDYNNGDNNNNNDYNNDINNDNNNNPNNSNDNSNTQTDNNNISEPDNPDNTIPNNDNNIVQETTYSISGKIWLDSNEDGRNDQQEEKISTIKVQLLKNGKMIKAVTSDGNGEYKFEELEKGNYNVIFLYDSEKYIPTIYKNKDVAEESNSDAIEADEGRAITEDLIIADSNLNNIDLGLKEKGTFDLNISKYISKATVKTEKNEKEYNFNDEALTKVEIRAKEINGSTVKLEYRIVVENIGTVDGNATKIADKIPEGMNFDEKENNGWYLGTDGNIYNETLKDTIIKTGEKAELKLILTKQMTGENTGVFTNKAILQETENAKGLKDSTDNNVSTQAMMITISTGGRVIAIIGSIVAITFALAIYMNQKKLNISFNKQFKNNTNKKIKTKKIYK